ncbi:MAG: beta-N-acetylglucosaminidase domain-containing protein [Chitinophagaceae bacterium]|nr:beta-N-acetylglucosaminidase domain-containing protein [Chitinophagaceae bacterium]
MMKSRFIITIIFFFFGIPDFCLAQKVQSENNIVSLKIRQDFFDRGNLIKNNSFELATVKGNDSVIHNFSLLNWTVIGKNVQLTDITRRSSNDSEAYSGIHAIKIVRSKEDVKEIDNESEGVLTDFIEVIPGNFDFYFDIRLENIIPSPYPERYHSRIDKGIDIHLQFYDKNKKPINPGYYFEYVNKKVDNSFKGFAFSNFFYIDKFGWARVKARTWNYPYSEGDLPGNCKYVKIFAGLKSSGTMWIDNLDFRLSKWSFTPMERMDSFFQKKYTLSQLLIPAPRLMANQQTVDLKNKKVSLVYDGKQFPEMNAAITLLRERFFNIYHDSVRVEKTEKGAANSKKLQIIFLDQANKASTEFAQSYHSIAGKDQGYFMLKKANKIYIGANKPTGYFYAASSLCQLINYENKTLDYVDITDYPDFTGRSTVLMGFQNKWEMQQNKKLSDSALNQRILERNKNLDRQLKDIDFYVFYKINLLYDNYFLNSKRWWMPGEFYNTYYSKIGDKCAQYGEIMNTAVQVNPYYHIEMEQRVDTLTDSLKNIFSHGTDDGFQKVLNVLKPALEAGAKTVMVCADDYIPHLGSQRGEYILFSKSDISEFTNLASAQYYLLNKLNRWLKEHYGDIRLEFVPPQYNNLFVDYTRGTAESYFHDLMEHLDPDIVIVWTGNTIRSLSYDAADIFRFTELIQKKPMVWDNSPYARMVESKNGGYPINYPEKSVLCNLFEPFDIQYPENFPSYIDDHYYSNLGGFGEINKIKYLTFADFSWNTNDYNPDFSLYKALVHYVGKTNAGLLLKFNDAYYQFVSRWGKLRMEREHNPLYQLEADELKSAQQDMSEMKAAFNALRVMDNKALYNELRNVMNVKIEAWNKLIQTAIPQTSLKK